VNEAKEFLFRECSNGNWSSEPDCYYVQPKQLPQCPEGFAETDTFCYIYSPKSKFPPKCPFDNPLPFDSFKSVVPGPVWMPVRRDLSNGLGFLQWTEHSALYRTTFEENFHYEGSITDKNCLLYHNASYIVAVSCDEEYQGVCAFSKLDRLSARFCGTCHQSDFSANSKCFCVGTNTSGLHQKAEFLKPYQNHIYDLLTSDVCTIGLEKTADGKYIWSSSREEIDYTFWSKDVIFDSTHIYGASTGDGWILTESPQSCSLFQTNMTVLTPGLDLYFDSDSKRFKLQVFGSDGLQWLDSEALINCYTNAQSSSLVHRYPNLTRSTLGDLLVVEFEVEESGPGDYWCEGFRYVDSEVVSSDVFNTRSVLTFGAEFVAILQVRYDEQVNPLSQEIVELLKKVLFPRLDEIPTYAHRIMKIVDLDELHRRVWINLHFTSVDPSSVADESEYGKLNTSISDALKNLENQIEMVEFYSLDYCLAEVSRNLSWPLTKAGEEATSEEYCFTSQYSPLKRTCLDDFFNGARWTPINESCEIALPSAVTQDILRVFNYTPPVPTTVVLSLTEEYQEFSALDVYLLTRIVKNPIDWNVTEVVKMFNNLLATNKDVLAEAQFKMRTSFSFLHFLDMFVSLEQSNVTAFDNNFAFVTLQINEYNGIVVQKSENGFEKTLIKAGTVEEILKLENLETAVWLSPKLYAQMIALGKKMAFTIFSNNGFFVENLPTPRSVTNVFGVELPTLQSYAGPVWHLHRVAVDKKLKPDCGKWSGNQMNLFEGTLKNGNESKFLICEIFKLGYHGLVVTPVDQNVTEILIDVLESDANSSEIIERLRRVSERYDEFVATDVLLTGQILKKVSDSEDIDLESLVQIVSNLHQIERDYLMESQMKDRATDTILFYVDAIVSRHKYQSQVFFASDNFMLLIYDLKETNFSGVVVFTSEETLEVEILTDDSGIDDLLKHDNLDSALLLSSELKQQLDEGGKIAVTLFHSDVLFNDKSPTPKVVGRIFGVILPHLTQYTGPVSIFHNITAQNNLDECSHWYYDEPSSVAGSWRSDSQGENISSLILCQFWHTTHFGLLLLDGDKYDDQLNILEWITTINCAMSLFGLCGIFFTAILFKTWRTNEGNQILLHFSSSIVLQIAAFYASNTINQHSLLCIIMGATLHYSMLSQFCWMLVVSSLQFIRFVVVLGGTPNHALLKACLFAWGLPLLPVMSVLISDDNSYASGKVGLCYPSGYGLYLGVWLPVSLIVCVNLVVFVCIMQNVIQKKVESCGGNNDTVYHWRIALLLFFMLGLTWVFGFLSEFDFGVVFVYLFCSTATLQGFVMFLFFIVFNANTRCLYSRAINRCFHNKYL
jgi:hypothetical protein